MTNEEMRIAVAEELGWEIDSENQKAKAPKCAIKMHGPFGVLCHTDWTFIPNWPEDLNACREMWNAPFAPPFEDDFNYRCEMAHQLWLIVQRDYEAKPDLAFLRCALYKEFNNLIPAAQEWLLLNASGRQLCESFLRVRNRWKE